MQSRDRPHVQPGPARRRFAGLGVAMILVAALASCCGSQVTPSLSATPTPPAAPATPTPNPTPAYADTLRIGWGPDPASAFYGYRGATEGQDPHVITLRSVVYSALYRFDATLNAVPDLPDGPCLPQGDGMIIRCHLIATTFQDGTPLTADDVAYTYQLWGRPTFSGTAGYGSETGRPRSSPTRTTSQARRRRSTSTSVAGTYPLTRILGCLSSSRPTSPVRNTPVRAVSTPTWGPTSSGSQTRSSTAS